MPRAERAAFERARDACDAVEYVAPFTQLLVGFEVPYFELVGGARLSGFASELIADGDGPRLYNDYERLCAESILTLRVPIGVFRIEVTGGLSFAIAGDEGALPTVREIPVVAQLHAGIGFQFDTLAASDRPPTDMADRAQVLGCWRF